MEYIAKTFYGLEQVLLAELESIGAQDLILGNRFVSFSGDQQVLYKANMYLRCALRVLMPVLKFKATTEQQYYNMIHHFDWEKYLTPKDTIAIDSVVNSVYFNHSKYMALKCKDAIVDQFRKKSGNRPSIDTDNPTLLINVHINDDNCTISLDSSGESLHKRGYRKEKGEAPINEVLAAGLIKLTGWDGKSCFIDPMCGSGTMLIEAAMVAANVYPCMLRKSYGFMNWKDFNKDLYIKTLTEGHSKDVHVKIYGSDISINAVKNTNTNIRQLKSITGITLQSSDIIHFIPPQDKGIAIINPPYGERIGNEELLSLYSHIGNSLKKNFLGYTVWIISSNPDAMKQIGLHASKTITVYNGPLKCKFQKYEIYMGSKKKK